MTDVSLKGRHGASTGAPAATEQTGAADDAPLAPLAMVELLFFAYRDFTGEADAVLSELNFGRAHHRVLHFVHWTPGLRVIDLLDILKITKQSLARVLKGLLDGGYVEQRAGASDRRERLLFTTAAGEALAERLAHLQAARMQSALAEAGADAGIAVEHFLMAVIAPADRVRIRSLLNRHKAAR